MDSIVYAETNQIKQIAKEIIDLGNDFESNQSEKYFDLVSLEKDDYIDFANKIRSYGEKLNRDVNDIESTINTVIKKESM